MKNPDVTRLKRRMKANDERHKLKQEAFNVLKERVTQARARDILPRYQRAIREKRPPPPPATAKQVEALEIKIDKIQPPPPAPPPQVNVPEPTVIVERAEPDKMVREQIGELTSVSRDISQSMEAMLQILQTRDTEIEVSVTGRDAKGNIKTVEIKRI